MSNSDFKDHIKGIMRERHGPPAKSAVVRTPDDRGTTRQSEGESAKRDDQPLSANYASYLGTDGRTPSHTITSH
jgi:hypothetical protein